MALLSVNRQGEKLSTDIADVRGSELFVHGVRSANCRYYGAFKTPYISFGGS